MIYYISLPFLSLFLIVFQMMVADTVLFGKIGLELSLILVIYAGFRLDVIRGGILSFILGFVRDCLSCTISGLYTLIYVLVFLISTLASTRISPGQSSFIMVFTLTCALFESIIIVLFYPVLYGGSMSTHALKAYIPQILMASGLSPILFKAFCWIEGYVSGEAKQPDKRA